MVFEANDIPLMIEAIPISSESIIPDYFQGRDPEELGYPHFSKFTPFGEPSSEPAPPIEWKEQMTSWISLPNIQGQ